MLEFLKKFGISDETIDSLNNLYPDTVLFNLSCNKNDCIDIIKYMLLIGISKSAVESILIYNIDIFFKASDDIKELIDKQDREEFVELVNNDFAAISDIFKK